MLFTKTGCCWAGSSLHPSCTWREQGCLKSNAGSSMGAKKLPALRGTCDSEISTGEKGAGNVSVKRPVLRGTCGSEVSTGLNIFCCGVPAFRGPCGSELATGVATFADDGSGREMAALHGNREE